MRNFTRPALLLAAGALASSTLRRRRYAGRRRALRGQVALITGGSRGLGLAIAQELSSLGCRLVLTARDGEELERAQARLIASGARPGDILVQASDVSVPEEIQSVVDAATQRFGRIDILVNNAGVILVGPLEAQTLESFQLAMNINFFGALHTTLALLPQMLERRSGAIVNIASVGGKVAVPHLLPYVASKFAVVGWSQGLRAELAAKGIQVTTVNPGVMRTGSHIQARFAGDARAEYQWFAAFATSPAAATDAAGAARKVVRALIRGAAEVSIGWQSMAASHLSSLAPETIGRALASANEFLPQAPTGNQADPAPSFWGPDRSVEGSAYLGALPGPLEHAGVKAMKQFNQQPAQ